MTFFRRLLGLLLLLSALLTFGTACMSYTYSDALKNIPAVPTLPAQTPISTHRQAPAPAPAPATATATVQEAPAPVPPTQAALVDLSAELITFPYYHQVNEHTLQSQSPIAVVSVLLVPLAEKELADVTLWPEASIIILTGNLQPMLAAIQNLDMNAVLFAGGCAILTNLPITTITNLSVIVEPIPEKPLQIVPVNLKESSPFQSFLDNPDYMDNWQESVRETHVPREKAMSALLAGLGKTPVLLAASLFEPSGLDWTASTKSPYRCSFDWPMSDFLMEQGFIDSYRATRFSEETDVGNTWSGTIHGMDLSERVDFLYVKDIIPVETSVVEPSEPASFPKQSGVFGYFLIP